MIKIIAVGKKHESWVAEGIERYQKRLKRPFDVEWVLLPHSSLEGINARQEESERIISRLGGGEFVILLDEKGELLSSPQFSTLLLDKLESSRKITMVIGGAYGVSESLERRADAIWSLSPLVFPHQLVRLVVVEQLYRAQEIARGGSYHHE